MICSTLIPASFAPHKASDAAVLRVFSYTLLYLPRSYGIIVSADLSIKEPGFGGFQELPEPEG